jgi:hypothetical protein
VVEAKLDWRASAMKPKPLQTIQQDPTKHQSRTTVPWVGIAEAASKSTTAAENIAQAPAPLRLFTYGLFVELA